MTESNNPLMQFFNDIQKEKESIVNSKNGTEFEGSLRRILYSNGFNQVNPKHDEDLKLYLDKIKSKVLDVLSTEVLENDLAESGRKYTNIFVHQPYGSQQFPDFLIFTNSKIIGIESKYSKQDGNKPVWNSNLPKSSVIYIFGCYKKKDVTFFLGEDVLPHNERIILNKFFMEATMKLMNAFQEELKEKFEEGEMKFDKGFNVYIRKAFDQSQTINTNANINYFNDDREKYENNVIEFVKDLW